MKKIKFLFSVLSLMIATVAFAQNVRVSGVVTDAATGEGIPFASLFVKGTTNGTSADANGAYSISAPSNATLVFSSVGYIDQEVAINGRANVNVALEPDALALDETIVVAYGVQKKSSFVGSATQLSGEKLTKMRTTSIAKSLEGAVAGLQTVSSSGTPGSGATIHIRGFGSYSASQSPLIVVDGVPYEGSLNSINTNDIESLTVLKDAAANSMYGARGSNGVIMITTKRGTEGRVNITFDAKVGVNSRAVPEYDVLDNPGDYYVTNWQALRNQVYYVNKYDAAQAAAYASANLISSNGGYNIYKGVADDQVVVDGKLNPAATQRLWNDNWQKDVFQPGARQEYNLAVSGGSDKTQGYLSVSYLSDGGYVPMSGFKRISVRSKVDQTINKFIKAGLNVSYANTDQQTYGTSEGSNYSNLFMFSPSIAPIYPIYLYDANGNKQYNSKGEVLYDWGTTGRAYAANQNALGQLMTSRNQTLRDNITSRGYVNINILPNLVASVNVAFDVFNTKSVEFTTPNGGDAQNVNGRGYQTYSRSAALNANQLLTWTPSFGDHNLNVLLGHETKSDNSYTLTGHMTNFVDANNVDFSNATVYQNLDSYSSQYFLEGFFGRAEYNYANKYFASASYRVDGSSRFAKDKRWGDFWAVGASWNAKQEDFLRNATFLDMLKLKASFGTQGNDSIGRSMVYENLYVIDRVNGEAALTKSFRAAPDVTWEKSDNFNVGVDASFFNRLSVGVEYYIKRTKDMVYSRPLAPSQGSPSSQLVNDMDMQNNGIEFEITGSVIKNNNVKWDLSLNGTHYKNKITKAPSDWPVDGKQSGNFWREQGGSLYDYYLKEWAGVDPQTGAPQFWKYYKDGDEEKREITNSSTEASYRKIGKTPIPDLYGGFSSTLYAYGFDFSLNFAYQIGGYTIDSNYQSYMQAGRAGNNWHKDILNAWSETNTNTDVPRVQMNLQDSNATSTRFLMRSDYISLRNFTLGYTLPKKALKAMGVSNLRVYVSGDNVWYLSRRKGMDVRQSFSGGVGQTYSALRTISGGVQLTF